MLPRSAIALTLLAAASASAVARASDPPQPHPSASVVAARDDKHPEKPKPKPPPKPGEKPVPPAGKDKPHPADKPKPAEAPKTIGLGNEVDANLALTDIDGKPHKLADLRGKTVVVQFWSAHNGAAYDKRLAELIAADEKKGVVFVAVDADKADVEGAKDANQALHELLKQHGLDGKVPLVFDKDGALAKQFSASNAGPHAFVLDAKGVVRYAGAIDDDPPGTRKEGVKHYLSDAIDAVVAGKPVPVATTTPGENGKK